METYKTLGYYANRTKAFYLALGFCLALPGTSIAQENGVGASQITPKDKEYYTCVENAKKYPPELIENMLNICEEMRKIRQKASGLGKDVQNLADSLREN